MLENLNISKTTLLIWLIPCALLVCNFLLIRQNLQLRSDIAGLIAEQKIQAGEVFSEVKGVDLVNNPVSVSFNENKTKKVIFFSSTSCPFCKKQNPYWNEFIKQADPQKYEVLGIFNSREDKNNVAEYLKNNGFTDEKLSFKVLLLGDDLLQKNKLQSTPITVVVGENGVVEKAWFGLWDKTIISEVNTSLGLSIQPKS